MACIRRDDWAKIKFFNLKATALLDEKYPVQPEWNSDSCKENLQILQQSVSSVQLASRAKLSESDNLQRLQELVSEHQKSAQIQLSRPKPPATTLNKSPKKKFHCTVPNCARQFSAKYRFVTHKRKHLRIKPFSCTWQNCVFRSAQQCNVLRHIRVQHFGLPITKKQQQARNITDDRDPKVWCHTNEWLAQLLQ